MKSTFLIVSSIIIITNAAFSQNDSIQSFSLKEIQDYAVENSLNTKNARLDIDIAKKKIRETLEIGLPNVSSSFSYQDMIKQPVTLLPANLLNPAAPEGTYMEMTFGTQHNATFNLTGSQLIFNGEYFVGLKASKIYLKLSEENLIKEQKDVIETITQTYYLILIAERNKEILQSSFENINKLLYETEELYKSGFAKKKDVQQLKLNFETLKNAIKTIERQIEVSYKLLKYQIGFEYEKEIILTDKLENILNQVNIDILLSQEYNLNNSINYKLLNSQEQLSLLNVKREKAALLPSVSAFFIHQENAMRDEFNLFNTNEDWYPSTIVGLNINIPIFDMIVKRSKVQKAKLEFEKIKNIKSNSILGLELGAKQLSNDLSTSFEKYRSEKNNLDLAKEIYEDTYISYKKGMVSGMELTQAHNQYLSSQTNYFSSVYELLNAKNRYDKIMDNY